MLTLVEPLILDQLVDRPHLGCAMLIAACEERGVATRLIESQVRILADLCRRDARETLALQLACGDDARRPGARTLGRADVEEDVESTCDELRRLYATVVVERGPRGHLSGHLIERVEAMYRAANAISVAALERDRGHEVPVVRRYLEAIVQTAPLYVGFSLQLTFDRVTREVRRRVREELGLPVIAGGPLVTRLSPRDYAEVLEREAIDYLVAGAGEESLPALVEALEEGRDPATVPNVFFLRDGAVRGERRVVRLDLDALPTPDFAHCDLDGYVVPERVLPLETARGCTWNRCAFCSHHAGPHPRYQAWSAERTVAALARLRDVYGCRQFVLHDLEVPPGRARRLSEAIVAAGLDDLSVSALGRLSRGYRDRRLLKLMRRAGFTSMEWGLESGTQRVLDLMDKGTDVAVMGTVLSRAAELGLANQCFLLFGFPSETQAEAQETLAFVERHREHVARVIFDVLSVHEDSPLGREPERWGVRRDDSGAYTVTTGMSREQARAFSMRAFLRYQVDPGRFSNEAVRSIASGNVSRVLHPLLRARGLLATGEVRDRVAAGRLGEVFPVVLGEVDDGGGRRRWQPVHAGETPFMHRTAPPPARLLDAVEGRAFTLADGRRSIADICEDVGAASAAAAERFLLEALEGGLAVAFARPWPEPDGAGIY